MPDPVPLPTIIQGGMGVAVSDWRLARSVALKGHLGVVSGTAIDTVFVRRLQDGDPGGHLRRAIARFPIAGVGDAVRARFFVEGGKAPDVRYKLLSLPRLGMRRAREAISMLAAFAEVWLAREGHDGLIGMNLLTKVQLDTLPSLYGAMLAGVDTILMGAGIPREIPAALDALAAHRSARLRLDVEERPGEPAGPEAVVTLDPAAHWGIVPPPLRRPRFLAIVASHSLATLLARKATGRVDGFIVEGPTAGGHNAPPRGALKLDADGEPVYGPRDVVDLDAMRALGLPFWIAGGSGHPGRLRESLAAGAAGVQVGTLFAWCDESAFPAALKQSVLSHAARGEIRVRTDPLASPTGYPFKRVDWPDNPAVGAPRIRQCDLGYLRVAYRRLDGGIGYRCPGEPVAVYLSKDGRIEDTKGRQCLCNGLVSAIGHPQVQLDGRPEPPLVTSGDDLVGIAAFLQGRTRYTAADVIDYLTGTDPALAPALTIPASAPTPMFPASAPTPMFPASAPTPTFPASAPIPDRTWGLPRAAAR
jgi:NAD(P)H-dependent flavin oxidoreductase YrpB (nitropropane dioxygenase family)